MKDIYLQERERYDEAIKALRPAEYPMLQDSVYLDHAGSSLPSKSLMDAFASEISSTLYGNPHSGSLSSQLSASRIDDIRLRLLNFFGADPIDYDLVFVANATAGVKLVLEGMRCFPGGFKFAHHQACHTSLIGLREEATETTCLDDEAVRDWLCGRVPFQSEIADDSSILFSYTAQSHLDGKRYPLSWSQTLKEKYSNGSHQIFTLLDASSYCATTRLDLGDPAISPDFTALSLYKIFGFPDIGALIVRRTAGSIFDHRKYFGGGTVDMVVCGKEQWHAPKTQFLHERLEDGTLPFHSIMAVDIALNQHSKLFASMEQISIHTSYLTNLLTEGLRALRHRNGQPACLLYNHGPGSPNPLGCGPIVSFNIKDESGAWISLSEFEKLMISNKMHLRTGSLCSPAGIASALGIEPWEMRRNFSAGLRCDAENAFTSHKPVGVIRASLGAMSTTEDVERFLEFLREYFIRDPAALDAQSAYEKASPHTATLQIKAIIVYPIKSCAGFSIPSETQWEVRPEGLAWDREWCLVHAGSGQALSQKRCPQMVLLRPSLDFQKGVLRVKYIGNKSIEGTVEVAIPLSYNPNQFQKENRQMTSQVCGESISAKIYRSEQVNRFFTNVLGVPCVLARFPPGGRGQHSRTSKARLQKHQLTDRILLPGSFPDIPSPPDSDSEQAPEGKILLSNESPMLMVFDSSVKALNKQIIQRKGEAISDATFRSNIVLESISATGGPPPYSEDMWKNIRIGKESFRPLGACRRCQMICVDQDTGERRQEPLATLAKTRRFDGKVFFGIHMQHEPTGVRTNGSAVIHIGDQVTVNT